MLIMILDACRDLPEQFKSLRGRAGGRGLGFMSAVPGSRAQQVIMFATAPGMVASDGGTLGNGTFTYCFLGCVPPFTHSVVSRAVQLMMPTVS
jgi:hypothetical protein